MDIRLQIIFFFLLPLFVVVSYTTTIITVDQAMITSSESHDNLTQEKPLTEKVYTGLYSDGPHALLNTTVTSFMDKLNELLNEIEKEKISFLENLEDKKATRILQMFNTTRCAKPPQYEMLKDSFSLRFGLLEISIAEAMVDLRDKLNQMKRNHELESVIYILKQKACEYFDMAGPCKNIPIPSLPCLSENCSLPGQNIYSLLFKTSKPENQNLIIVSKQNRSLSTDCPSGEFRCLNGACVPQSFVCDREFDCFDESDEVIYPNVCPQNCSEKRCRNLKCLSENQICNGIDDCGDGTDEEICLTNNVSDIFTCSNKSESVPYTAVCNGKPDCRDNSDEGVYCSVTNGCDRCSAMGGVCLRTPAGPLCLSSCPSGFVLDLESGVCEHIKSLLGRRTIYKNETFFAILNRIKTLFIRFSNAFILMRKDLNQEIIKSLTNLKGCIPEEPKI